MGLIKTAMMSGAAVYAVKQVANTAQSRNNNSQPPRYRDDYSDRVYDTSRHQQMDFRYPESRSQRYSNTQERGTQRSNDWEPRQPLHITDQRSFDQQPYYVQEGDNDLPQYYYTANTRSSSAPAYSYQNQHRQQGFVESEETYDPRELQRGRGGQADMVNMLAQQAISMGLVGGRKGKKDKDSKGDLLSSLISK